MACPAHVVARLPACFYSSPVLHSINPSLDKKIGVVSEASAADVDIAV